VIKAEVHESHEVDSGCSVERPQGVPLDAAEVAEACGCGLSTASDRALDHRTVLAVGLLELEVPAKTRAAVSRA